MKCATVKVKNEEDFYIINEEDFDKEEHELFVEEKKKEKGKDKK